jgi:phosphoribosylaminoimidazole-succinocarboxamide synthase
LVGSGYKEYKNSETVCGLQLPGNLELASKLPEPIFTPSTKADEGHDENISFDKMANIIGKDLAEKLRDYSLALYKFAADYALDKGIIIADTKFEFGLIDGEVVVIDEMLTPDSSRFWPKESYLVGKNPPSFDKQFVRDYLESCDWDKTPPAPALPDEIVSKTVEKYLEAYSKLTGMNFKL